MKRREFVTSVLATGLAAPAAAAVSSKQDEHHHRPLSGPLASATVSFGHWRQFDRVTAALGPNDRTQNGHALIPHEVFIKAGGTVNFIIGGFHQVIVYGPGTKPEDINPLLIIPGSAPPGLIDDPTNRVYRGIDPRILPLLNIVPQTMPPTMLQDRVEVVVFPNPGRHLVICGVVPHFVNDGMFGFVRVLR